MKQIEQTIMTPYEIPASVLPLPNRALLAASLGNDARWTILKELAKGEPRMTIELAKLIGKSPDATAKLMYIPLEAGIVVQGRGRLYSIPKQYLPQPGQAIVDYGHCLLRLDAA